MATSQAPFWIDPANPDCQFPDTSLALTEPNGLLAVGGNLSPDCLLNAYRQGIFPWYSNEQPILWWSPDPRSVLIPKNLKVSRSLAKVLNKNDFTVTFDQCFEQVITACAGRRPDYPDTWITSEMANAYRQLHELGYAHSVETWFDGELVGGLYGIAMGRLFFGESMFHKRRDASKVAFVRLVRQLDTWGFPLIDCQISSAHLDSLGAQSISRKEFIHIVSEWSEKPSILEPWEFEHQ